MATMAVLVVVEVLEATMTWILAFLVKMVVVSMSWVFLDRSQSLRRDRAHIT